MGFLEGVFKRGKKGATAKVTTAIAPEPTEAKSARDRDRSASSRTKADKLNLLEKIQILEEKKVLIEKRINQLDREIESDVKEAKGYLVRNQRSRAEAVLRRKKLKETERQNKINFVLRVELDVETLKALAGQVEDLEALRVMRDASASIMREVDADRVAEMQEEIEDARDQMRDLSDILYAAPISEHDTEVEAELASLLGELEGEAKGRLLERGMPEAMQRPMPNGPIKSPAVAGGVPTQKRLEAAGGPGGVQYTVESKSKVDKEAEDELAMLTKEMGL